MYHNLYRCGGNPPHRGAGRPKHKAKSVSYYVSFTPTTTIPSSSSVFPSQNITITIYTTVTFPIIWVWKWSLKLGEKHRLRIFENRVLGKLLVLQGSNNRRMEKTA